MSVRSLCVAVAALAVALPAAAAAADPAKDTAKDRAKARDWAQTLVDDAQAFHDAVASGHPGPVDAENPGFKALLERGLTRAKARAAKTRDFGGYWWAMREYVASFDDGHVQFAGTAATPDTPDAWAGVLTRLDGERLVVADRLDEPELPPFAAELVACDGVPAAKLAAERVGRFQGRWMLASQHVRHAPKVLVDLDNPWAPRPHRCLFKAGGVTKVYALNWRSIPHADLTARMNKAAQAYRAPIEARRLTDGWWVSMGSFEGTPGSEPAKKLTALTGGLKADPQALRASPRIVLDLRGNGGGSSHWSREIAEAIWGEDYVAANAPRGSDGVDWRVSDQAISTFERFRAGVAGQPNADAQVLAWIDNIVAGLKRAKADGRPLWRETSDPAPEAAKPAAATASAYAGRVFVLTDPACASACLDAVDLWKGLGAVQVGRETAGDTQYMEVGEAPLPSGLAAAGVPMKVYRGRTRGPNQPQRPAFVYDGEMADTAALEAWIGGLK